MRWDEAIGSPAIKPGADVAPGAAVFKVTLIGFDVRMLPIGGVLQPKDIPVKLPTEVSQRGPGEVRGSVHRRHLLVRTSQTSAGFHRVGAAVDLASYGTWNQGGTTGIEVRVVPDTPHPDDDGVGLFVTTPDALSNGRTEFFVRLME